MKCQLFVMEYMSNNIPFRKNQSAIYAYISNKYIPDFASFGKLNKPRLSKLKYEIIEELSPIR